MRESQPIDLPEQLTVFLQANPFACLSILTDLGTAYILKAPGFEIERCRGTLPISLHHELYVYPTAPIIRTLISIYDQPDSSLLFESFINVADPEQHSEFENLSHQARIPLFFYDEHTQHRLSKMIGNPPQTMTSTLLKQAENYYRALPAGRFDFDLAKAKLMEQHPLTDYGKS